MNGGILKKIEGHQHSCSIVMAYCCAPIVLCCAGTILCLHATGTCTTACFTQRVTEVGRRSLPDTALMTGLRVSSSSAI